MPKRSQPSPSSRASQHSNSAREDSQTAEADKVERILYDFIKRIINYYEKFKVNDTLLVRFEEKISESDTLLEVFEVMKEMFEELMSFVTKSNL